MELVGVFNHYPRATVRLCSASGRSATQGIYMSEGEHNELIRGKWRTSWRRVSRRR